AACSGAAMCAPASASGAGFADTWATTFPATTLFLLLSAVVGLCVVGAAAFALVRANRKLAQTLAARRRDEAIMRASMENMAEVVIMVDGSLRLTSFIQRFAEITGCGPDFLARQPMYADALRLWAGEKQLPDRLLERALLRARTREPFRHTFVPRGR